MKIHNHNIPIDKRLSSYESIPRNNNPPPNNLLNLNQAKDKVSISTEAWSLFMENLDSINKDNSPPASEQSIVEIMEEIKRQAEEKEGPFDDLYRCIVIAMRIMKGDNVPLKDENFLAENQPELYLRSILLREEKEDPKEYESLLKDKKEKNPFESLSSPNSIPISGLDEIISEE